MGVRLGMRTAVVLKGTLLLLALLECCVHGTAQADPLKHHQKLCNINRDCIRIATCYTKSLKRCRYKDEAGKCFLGECVCKSNHNLMYPACKFEQPTTEATTTATTGQSLDKCGNRCRGEHEICNNHGNCECRYGGRWPRACCQTQCPQGETCDIRGKCDCSSKRLANGKCSKCNPPCFGQSRCNEEEGVCRSFWPCSRKCGRGGTCEIFGSKEVCRRCGRRRRRRLFFYRRRCLSIVRWNRLCIQYCGGEARKAKCRTEGQNELICISCGQGFRLVDNDKGKKICKLAAPWSQWGDCSVTCGAGGVQSRTRECSNSDECGGEASETRNCPESPDCPTVSEWTEWSKCSVTCGSGTQTRTQECLAKACKGRKWTENKDCENPGALCNVDCNWCEWESVGDACRGTRTRKPNCPAKEGTGADCKGDSEIKNPYVGRGGPKRSKDFHTSQLGTHVLKIECRGGCINIFKAVHDCLARNSRGDELQLVKDRCQDKESCTIKDFQSFFGHRGCRGIKKSWFGWNCYNHEAEYSFNNEG